MSPPDSTDKRGSPYGDLTVRSSANRRQSRRA